MNIFPRNFKSIVLFNRITVPSERFYWPTTTSITVRLTSVALSHSASDLKKVFHSTWLLTQKKQQIAGWLWPVMLPSRAILGWIWAHETLSCRRTLCLDPIALVIWWSWAADGELGPSAIVCWKMLACISTTMATANAHLVFVKLY